MLAWDHATGAADTSPLAHGTLTEGEVQRLEALRERWSSRPDCVELELDIRRLRFARWLVQRGILTEDI